MCGLFLSIFLAIEPGYHVLKRGETLPFILKKSGVSDTTTSKIISIIKGKLDLRRCRAGDSLLVTQRGEKFIELRYENSKTTIIVDSLFRVSELEIKKKFVFLNGVIKNGSLWDAVITAGGTPALIYIIADEIFSSDIDFNVETHNGDEFELLTYAEYSGDRFIGYGKILFATYVCNKQKYTGIYYDNASHRGYYSLEGKSLRKLFLRSPVGYIRISSGFTKARFHPVLRKWMPHLGIDYAAPTGTPIKAIGDGVVAFAGRNKGYGKQVIIQHGQGFKSYYGHLSKINVSKGKHVKQGDMIGKVGRTGLATGPHLDFKLQKNGKYVNPLKIIPPPVKPLYGKELVKYKNYVDGLNLLISTVEVIKEIPLLEIKPPVVANEQKN